MFYRQYLTKYLTKLSAAKLRFYFKHTIHILSLYDYMIYDYYILWFTVSERKNRRKEKIFLQHFYNIFFKLKFLLHLIAHYIFLLCSKFDSWSFRWLYLASSFPQKVSYAIGATSKEEKQDIPYNNDSHQKI